MSCYLRVPLNHPLVMLAVTPSFFLLLSILLACEPQSTLITMFTYLLLRCILSDRYGNFFNSFSIDLKDAYIHIPMLSITVTFNVWFGSTNCISGGFCHLGWLQTIGFLHHSLSPYCSFVVTSVFMFLLFWIIFWS